MRKIIKIDGMSCGHCVKAVEKALNALEGVTSVDVNLGEKQATAESTCEISDSRIKEVIEEAGYEIISIQ